jgi:aminopeptidase-like protein
MNEGEEIYSLAQQLFLICRSLTGDGVRKTLRLIKNQLPELEIHEVPSGTGCFDWTVPDEWNINDAYIIDPDGNKIADFRQNNLHVAGYSIPVDKTVSLDELQNHLYSLPEKQDAIPYITSYYKKHWGFCITDKQRRTLKQGRYRVRIDSSLKPGHLTYAELIIRGQSSQEIFLSTYICHPSLANNELSGPCVTAYLAKWLRSLEHRRYTYRIIFIPETIGSIYYLSRNLEYLKEHVIAGFNVSCVGDERTYSFLPSRQGNTLADRVALHVLKHIYPDFKRYSFLDRGSDERQYCSPGVDLPVVLVGRSKYEQYPEYHTSKDNMDFITPEGLYGGYNAIRQCLICLEHNEKLKTTVLCEPQLGRRGLYPSANSKVSREQLKPMMDLIAYADGTNDLLGIADLIGREIWSLFEIVNKLKNEKLLVVCE